MSRRRGPRPTPVWSEVQGSQEAASFLEYMDGFQRTGTGFVDWECWLRTAVWHPGGLWSGTIQYLVVV